MASHSNMCARARYERTCPFTTPPGGYLASVVWSTSAWVLGLVLLGCGGKPAAPIGGETGRAETTPVRGSISIASKALWRIDESSDCISTETVAASLGDGSFVVAWISDKVPTKANADTWGELHAALVDERRGVIHGPDLLGFEKGLDASPTLWIGDTPECWVIFHDLQSISAARYLPGVVGRREPTILYPVSSRSSAVAMAVRCDAALLVMASDESPGAVEVLILEKAGSSIRERTRVSIQLEARDAVVPIAAVFDPDRAELLSILYEHKGSDGVVSLRETCLVFGGNTVRLEGVARSVDLPIERRSIRSPKGTTATAFAHPSVGAFQSRLFSAGIRITSEGQAQLVLVRTLREGLTDGQELLIASSPNCGLLGQAMSVTPEGAIHISWLQRTREEDWVPWYAVVSDELGLLLQPQQLGEEFSLEFAIEGERRIVASEVGALVTWAGRDDKGPALWICVVKFK